MDEKIPDHIQSFFAEITSKLEDASMLAAHGQSPHLKITEARTLCSEVRAALTVLLKQTQALEDGLRDGNT